MDGRVFFVEGGGARCCGCGRGGGGISVDIASFVVGVFSGVARTGTTSGVGDGSCLIVGSGCATSFAGLEGGDAVGVELLSSSSSSFCSIESSPALRVSDSGGFDVPLILFPV